MNSNHNFSVSELLEQLEENDNLYLTVNGQINYDTNRIHATVDRILKIWNEMVQINPNNCDIRLYAEDNELVLYLCYYETKDIKVEHSTVVPGRYIKYLMATIIANSWIQMVN